MAARGGLVGSKYAWGESPSTTRANFDQTLHGATIPVGSFPANGYGLYEIGGNLREWTWDSNETTTDANSSQNLVMMNSTLFRRGEGLSAVFWEYSVCTEFNTQT